MSAVALKEKPKVSNPKIEILKVTPEMAQEWLRDNPKNRQLSQATINKYARDIAAGLWEVNGEAIKIAQDGKLLDGQHRLYAVCKVQMPITALVVSNLPNEVFHTLDIGRPRSAADVFHIRGESYALDLAAVCRLMYAYTEGNGDFSKASLRKNGVPIQQVEKALAAHPDIRMSVAQTAELGNRRIITRSVAGILHYLFSLNSKKAAAEFFDKLLEGHELSKGDPILTLRNTLTEWRNDHRGWRNQITMLGFTINTWNAYRAGKKNVDIEWNPGTEFPKISK